MKPYKKLFENLHFFMKEAVIHTEKYQIILGNVFYSIFKKIPFNKSCEDTIKKLDVLFGSYKINFKLCDENDRNGVVRGKTINEIITIFISFDCNKYFNNKFEFSKFVDKCLLVLSHELVHRGQYLQSIKHAHINNNFSLDTKECKYYSNKQEIMAFANMIIEELRFNGYSNQEIIEGIKINLFNEQESEFLFLYQKNFRNDAKIINILYKYIFLYLKEPIKIEL